MSGAEQRDAAGIRERWLGWALSTRPADRPAAEAAIRGLYRLIGLGPPRFHWVSSPATGLATVPPGTRPRPSETMERIADWPLPRRFTALANALRVALDFRFLRVDPPLGELARRAVHGPLSTSETSLAMALWAAHDSQERRVSPWYYEAQGVSWLAHYDALRRLTGVAFTPGQAGQFELWATLARSCGWW